jgi:high-affinity iron transporter
MKKNQNRFLIAMLIAMLAASNILGAARAISDSPAQIAESIRTSLVRAQLSLMDDPKAAAELLNAVEVSYQTGLAAQISASNPEAHMRVTAALKDRENNVSGQQAAAFAAARAQAWTGILAGSYSVVEEAIQNGDGVRAQTWLPLREFRTATRFSRPNVSATVSVESFISGTASAEDALLAVRADVLDTYQARLSESLHDLTTADTNGFASRRAAAALSFPCPG